MFWSYSSFHGLPTSEAASITIMIYANKTGDNAMQNKHKGEQLHMYVCSQKHLQGCTHNYSCMQSLMLPSPIKTHCNAKMSNNFVSDLGKLNNP